MIQTVTYRARLDGKSPEEALAKLNSDLDFLTRKRPELLGADVTVEGVTVKLSLRLQGLDRWKISANGRRLGTFLFTAARVHFVAPLQPELVVSEPTRNKLHYGTGRTEMARPPRAKPLPE